MLTGSRTHLQLYHIVSLQSMYHQACDVVHHLRYALSNYLQGLRINNGLTVMNSSDFYADWVWTM
uniref:Uncharacterized protein n=1 Tax=Wuchereria bancrofti TaxID=6293 RepID=A0A1I8EXJ2_WUCBA